MPRLHSQRPSQLVSHLLRQLIPSPTRVSPVPAFRLAGGSTAIPRHLAVILRRLPSPGPLSPWFSSRRDGATLGSPGSVPVRAVTATLAAGVEAVAGGAGMAAARAVITSRVVPRAARWPLDPAAVPAAVPLIGRLPHTEGT